MPTVTSRIVAVIYRGIDFPPGWVDQPDVLNIGMALDTVVSVAAMFDAEQRPVALCWRMGDREEKFVCADSSVQEDISLVDELNQDLAQESRRLGTEDLLGTMLWAPDELRPDQGQQVHHIVFVPGRVGSALRPLTGWNIASRTLVAQAGQLLMMTRSVDDDLALDVPLSLDDMHRHMGSSVPRLLTVLPGVVSTVPEQDVNRKLALLFGGLLVAGTLISAWLLSRH